MATVPPPPPDKTPRIVKVDTFDVRPTVRDGVAVIDERSTTTDGKNFFGALLHDAYITVPRSQRLAVTGDPKATRGFRALTTYLERLRQPPCAKLGEAQACDGVHAAIDAYIRDDGPIGMEGGKHVIATPASWTTYVTDLARPFDGKVDVARMHATIRKELGRFIDEQVANLETLKRQPAPMPWLLDQRLIRLAALADVWASTKGKEPAAVDLIGKINALDALRQTLPVHRVD